MTVNLSRLRIRHIDVFLAVARYSGIQEAARHVHLTQPAVTKIVDELESIFGAQLIERAGRGIVLTESGTALAHHMRSIRVSVERTGEEVGAIAQGTLGHIRLGVHPAAEVGILPTTLLAVRERAPDLTIGIEEGTRRFLLTALRRGEIDGVIARLNSNPEENDLTRIELIEIPVSIVCGARHPLTKMRRVSWHDTSKFPWILPETGTPIRKIIEQKFSTLGLIPPKPAFTSTSIRLNHLLLAGADMIGVMTDDNAHDYCKAGVLATLDLPMAITPPPAGIIMRSDFRSRAMEIFLDILREKCAEHRKRRDTAQRRRSRGRRRSG